MQPDFLTLADILQIHENQIERYGGEAGVRDVGLLQSAIAAPQAGFGGKLLHDDIYKMAAAYLFHIVKNHPFVDGNKRTGTTAAIVFLAMNEIKLDADEEAFADLVIAVASGKAGKAAVAEFIRENVG